MNDDRYFTCFGELDGIADQIEQDLDEAQGVANQVVGYVRCDVVEQLQTPLAGLQRADVTEVTQTGVETEGRLLEMHHAGFDLRQVENVVDDPEQSLGRVIDLAQIVSLA